MAVVNAYLPSSTEQDAGHQDLTRHESLLFYVLRDRQIVKMNTCPNEQFRVVSRHEKGTTTG